MGKDKGENAELPTLGEVAQVEIKADLARQQENAVSRRTLQIWDVPTELANKFISTARGSYGNKSWLFFQDLMKKADLYDQMVSSGKLEELDRRLARVEEFADRMNEALSEEQEKEETVEKAKKPKHFGAD